MNIAQQDDGLSLHTPSQESQEQRILESLSALSYRSGDLKAYLRDITIGVSRLLNIDWSTVNLCQDGFERVMASSIDFEGMDQLFSLHGSLTNTVVTTGKTLVVEDVRQAPEQGSPPEGYLCYLGVPLRTAQGETIGTVCSFNHQPRQFTEQQIRIAELFAERAATAIDNYHLYQKQLQFNETLEQEVAIRTEELKAAQAKLMEQERLAAIGEFAAMIVHEIRNPLTTMVMGLKYAKKVLRDQMAQERLLLSLDEADRLERLLSEILLYAKPQVLKLEALEVNQFVRELLMQIDEMPEARERLIDFIPSATQIRIAGDKDKLKQVLINLIRNACEAVPVGDIVKFEIAHSAGNQVCITIQNGGDPIPPEVLPKLTQPFYSTKPEGTGLGLAITKRIVCAHDGELTIQSNASIGTVIRVQFPIID